MKISDLPITLERQWYKDAEMLRGLLTLQLEERLTKRFNFSSKENITSEQFYEIEKEINAFVEKVLTAISKQ